MDAKTEPTFSLRASDPGAAAAVRRWALECRYAVDRGERPETDMVKVKDARDAADAMDAWRSAKGRAA